MVSTLGCDSNRVILETVIEPNITYHEGNIAVEYMLGDLLILDTWYNLNTAEELFLADNNRKKTVKLRVKLGDFGFSEDGFFYSIGNISVKTSPVKWKVFKEYVHTMPNVVWEIKDGKYITDKSKNDKSSEKNNTTKTL